jgi:FkbM family methyltransferase
MEWGIFSLSKDFITKVKKEGANAALKAAIRMANWYLTEKLSHFKHFLFVSYYNMFHHGLVLREIQGNRMYLNVSDQGLSQDLLTFGVREPTQTELLRSLIENGMTIVDIGANLGYYTLIEASIVGETGKVYAIEPILQNCKILKKNVRKNKYENIVEVYQYAVSDNCGIGKIAVTKESNYCTMFLSENELSEVGKKQLEISIDEIIDVETITLDEFLVNKRQPDLIRMDVEGYEGTIIKGMSNTLRNAKNGLWLFIEIHPCYFQDRYGMTAEIIQDLAKAGLNVRYIISSEESKFVSFSEDNVITTICNESSPGTFLQK